MPFKSTASHIIYGIAPGSIFEPIDRYCQVNTSAGDYGQCYVAVNKAIFIQSDTSTYPQLPCETSGTCIRYTNTVWDRVITTVYDYSSVNKQGIVRHIIAGIHTSIPLGIYTMSNITRLVHLRGIPRVILHWDVTTTAPHSPYDPVLNMEFLLNIRAIPSGTASEYRADLNWLSSTVTVNVLESYLNNQYLIFGMLVAWHYESSPVLIALLDYEDDYLPNREILKNIGYSYNGVAQPGWNAEDMVNIMSELFPDRPWVVADPDSNRAYSNGLDIDNIIEISTVYDLIGYSVYVLKTLPKPVVSNFVEELLKRNGVDTGVVSGTGSQGESQAGKGSRPAENPFP